MGKWFSYPRRLIIDASVPAFIAIILPVFPLIVVYILLIIIRYPIPEFDINRLSGGLIFAISCGWALFLAANLPRAYAYWQRFKIGDDGVMRSIFRHETKILWNEIKMVESVKQHSFEYCKPVIEEYVIIVGLYCRYVIYDKIGDFIILKNALSSACDNRGIPLYSVDRTHETLQKLRREDPDLYQKSRRRGLRRRVDHL